LGEITTYCTHCGAEVNNDNGCPTGCDDGAIFKDGLEAELVTDKFFNILKMICQKNCPAVRLTNFINTVKNICEENSVESSDFFEEVFPDVICEEVNEIINDHSWRSDLIGEKALKDQEILRDLFEILLPFDENIEVVFATNPYTPEDVLVKLCSSTFTWEEDSTTSALARNTKDQNILKQLLLVADESTKFSIAGNLNTPMEVLETLADDEGFSHHKLYWAHADGLEIFQCSIKYSVLHNPKTPFALIEKFASGEIEFKNNPFEDLEKINSGFKNAALEVLQKRITT
jgi:hypothetical protein